MLPETITITLPEDWQNERMCYKGPPIPIYFEIDLTGFHETDCVAIVPCRNDKHENQKTQQK